MKNLHLHLTIGKQLVESFCYNIDKFDVPSSQFLVAPFFKIFCYLAGKADIMNLSIQQWIQLIEGYSFYFPFLFLELLHE